METKRVTGDFGDRSILSLWTPDRLAFIMNEIESIFEECDEELTKAGMAPLGYEKQPINTMIEHMVVLITYVFDAYPQCCSELDHPLYVGFKNGAAETLSNIVLEDITTDNTFNMQEYVEVYDVEGTFYRGEVKPKLTMKDFLGLDEVIPGGGAPVLENVETVGWFKELFRADYESMSASVESVDQMLEIYLHGGEYGHKEYHPIGNFVSGILDITIIKPFIESIYGYDLITGEKLTDFERGMQLVNAVVGAVTLGQGALALNFAGMSGKEAVTVLVKIWAVDAVADMSAYTVGYACDELGMPAGITFLASLATGCTVSVKAGKYVFQDASGSIVKELDADGMQAFIKEVGVDESLLGPMSEEELRSYMKFLKNGSTAGMTQGELRAIQKVDGRLLLDQIDYDEVLTLRKGVNKGGLDTIIKNGKISIDDIKTNPSAFSGKSAEEIADVLRNSGYDVTIKNSTRSRSGAQIIQINNPGGGKNISQVQVSPGGGRHGSNPYVKISTTDQGIIKIVDGIESTYKTDGKKTASIIFSGGN